LFGQDGDITVGDLGDELGDAVAVERKFSRGTGAEDLFHDGLPFGIERRRGTGWLGRRRLGGRWFG